ncbi:MAG TPA: inositol monophosphatase [Gammaproteobacteria bacterium]
MSDLHITLKTLQSLIKQHAAREIMPRYKQVAYSLKKDGSLVTAADDAMQAAMIESLRALWPEYKLLGEEMTAQQQQALLDEDSAGLWVLDPLDGTSNFASGVPIFSVSLALIKNSQVVLGMIYDPNRDEMFSAIGGEGAWLNEQPLQAATERELLAQCTAQIDFKRLSPAMRVCLAREHPYASQRNFGSGALDWCWLAAARSQVYIHGGQKLWDYAAGQLILQEAGGFAATFEGEPVLAETLTPRSVMAAVSEPLFQQLQQYLNSIDCQ